MNEIEGTIPAEEVVEAEVYLVETPSQSGAEVIDAREGHDGSIFDNLGQAIRTQISDLWDNKAPAGHGLGGSGAYVDNLDTLKTTGVYTFTHGATGNPFSGWGGIVEVSVSKTGIKQVVTCNTKNGVSARRLMYLDSNKTTWEDWEWVNPPMVLGTEYRTTKRHNGKVVYAKAISIGKMPVSSARYDNLVTGVDEVVDYIFTMSSYQERYTNNSHVKTLGRNTSAGSVFAEIVTDVNISSFDAYLTISYTKV